MSALTIVHIHGGTREHRNELALALQATAITVLRSSTTAEAAKCLRDSRVRVSVLLDNALSEATISTLRDNVRLIQPSRDHTVSDTVRAVLHQLHHDVPTSST